MKQQDQENNDEENQNNDDELTGTDNENQNGGEVSRLSEISKEFADKYLLKGKNFLHEGKIYHYGEPKNFSFTPSEVWLRSFQNMLKQQETPQAIDEVNNVKRGQASGHLIPGVAFEDGFSRRNRLWRHRSERVSEDAYFFPIHSARAVRVGKKRAKRQRRNLDVMDESDATLIRPHRGIDGDEEDSVTDGGNVFSKKLMVRGRNITDATLGRHIRGVSGGDSDNVEKDGFQERLENELLNLGSESDLTLVRSNRGVADDDDEDVEKDNIRKRRLEKELQKLDKSDVTLIRSQRGANDGSDNSEDDANSTDEDDGEESSEDYLLTAAKSIVPTVTKNQQTTNTSSSITKSSDDGKNVKKSFVGDEEFSLLRTELDELSDSPQESVFPKAMGDSPPDSNSKDPIRLGKSFSSDQPSNATSNKIATASQTEIPSSSNSSTASSLTNSTPNNNTTSQLQATMEKMTFGDQFVVNDDTSSDIFNTANNAANKTDAIASLETGKVDEISFMKTNKTDEIPFANNIPSDRNRTIELPTHQEATSDQLLLPTTVSDQQRQHQQQNSSTLVPENTNSSLSSSTSFLENADNTIPSHQPNNTNNSSLFTANKLIFINNDMNSALNDTKTLVTNNPKNAFESAKYIPSNAGPTTESSIGNKTTISSFPNSEELNSSIIPQEFVGADMSEFYKRPSVVGNSPQNPTPFVNTIPAPKSNNFIDAGDAGIIHQKIGSSGLQNSTTSTANIPGSSLKNSSSSFLLNPSNLTAVEGGSSFLPSPQEFIGGHMSELYNRPSPKNAMLNNSTLNSPAPLLNGIDHLITNSSSTDFNNNNEGATIATEPTTNQLGNALLPIMSPQDNKKTATTSGDLQNNNTVGTNQDTFLMKDRSPGKISPTESAVAGLNNSTKDGSLENEIISPKVNSPGISSAVASGMDRLDVGDNLALAKASPAGIGNKSKLIQQSITHKRLTPTSSSSNKRSKIKKNNKRKHHKKHRHKHHHHTKEQHSTKATKKRNRIEDPVVVKTGSSSFNGKRSKVRSTLPHSVVLNKTEITKKVDQLIAEENTRKHYTVGSPNQVSITLDKEAKKSKTPTETSKESIKSKMSHPANPGNSSKVAAAINTRNSSKLLLNHPGSPSPLVSLFNGIVQNLNKISSASKNSKSAAKRAELLQAQIRKLIVYGKSDKIYGDDTSLQVVRKLTEIGQSIKDSSSPLANQLKSFIKEIKTTAAERSSRKDQRDKIGEAGM